MERIKSWHLLAISGVRQPANASLQRLSVFKVRLKRRNGMNATRLSLAIFPSHANVITMRLSGLASTASLERPIGVTSVKTCRGLSSTALLTIEGLCDKIGRAHV